MLGVGPDGVVEPAAPDAGSGSHATAYCPHCGREFPLRTQDGRWMVDTSAPIGKPAAKGGTEAG